MSNHCVVCGKSPRAGKNVSHSNRKTVRRFHPNIQTVRIQTPAGGAKRATVCARCLRSGKVKKAA